MIHSLLNQEARGKIKSLMLSVIIGGFCFLISWGLYSYLKDLPFLSPFEYLFASFMTKQIHGAPWERFFLFLRAGVRLTLWWSPFLVVIGIMAILERVRAFWKDRIWSLWDSLILYTLVGLIGYIWVGGVPYGFPRYHAAILPILSLLISVYIVRVVGDISKRDIIIVGMMILVCIIFWVFMIGDPIHTFNFVLRDTLIHEPQQVRQVLRSLLKQELLFVFLMCLVIISLRFLIVSKNWHRLLVMGLGIALISSSLGMNIVQAKAGYLTRFCYGDQGTEEMLGFLKSHVNPGDLVVATRDIVYYVGNDLTFWGDSLWNSEERFNEVIQLPEVKYVIYSVGHHTIKQHLNTFYHPIVRNTLALNFMRSQIGTYAIWSRK